MKKIFLNKKIIILGADGFLGSRLFGKLSALGADVWGTFRKSSGRKIINLNTFQTESINNFPWSDFEIIFDCIGNIDYRNLIESAECNFQTNLIGPLQILKKLSGFQEYFYCSTHAVLAPLEKQNSYSLSKLSFELCIRDAENISAKVHILRIPAIFSEERQSGLLYAIKKSFEEKKAFEFVFSVSKWHTMYLPRLIDILILSINSNDKKLIENIGYSSESNINIILESGEEVLGPAPIKVVSINSDHYIPDIVAVGAPNTNDFKKDLKEFFKK